MTPKRIWIAQSDLPQLMHNGLVMDTPEDGTAGFVRSDIVQELVEALDAVAACDLETSDGNPHYREIEVGIIQAARAALAKLQEDT